MPGYFIVDRDSKVLYANKAATRMLSEGLMVVKGVLTAGSAAGRQSLAGVVERAFDRRKVRMSAPVLIPRSGMHAPYVAYSVQLTPFEDEATPPTLALLIVIDADAELRMPPEFLVERFRIAPNEARVVSEIALGRRPRDAAKSLGLKEGSVRVILKRAFAKMGVSHQSELVARVARLSSIGIDQL